MFRALMLTALLLPLLVLEACAVVQGQQYCSGTCTNGTIRLVGGSTPYMGRLEVCFAGCWGTVCGNDFDALDAAVACRQLGFIALGVSPQYNGYYGYGSGPIWLYSLSCNGNETSLFDCPHYDNGYYMINGPTSYSNDYGLCDHSSDIGIICPGPRSCSDGDVRLVNGTALWNGTVEICLGEQWTTICDSYYWTSDTSGANTVCKQLGYSSSNAMAYVSSYLGRSGSVFLSNVHCDARTLRLVDCYYNNLTMCSGYTGGVLCQVLSTRVCSDGAVRLVGGSNSSRGRVEVCAHKSWGTVCNNYWDSLDASVVCGQLGYQSVGAIPYSTATVGAGTGPVWLQNLMCTGSEQQLFNCSVMATTYAYCSYSNGVSAQCAVSSTSQNCTDWSIRLVGGSSPSQGRVEVCYKKQWGTMCSYGGYISTFASVICRQLGYSYFNATVYLNSHFGGGSGGIYLYLPTLLCTGNENSLQECYHPPVGYHECYDHSIDIGVACQAGNVTYNTQCANGAAHLVGGSTSSEGRYEICLGGTWTTLSLSPSSSDSQNAAVLCRQLGFTTSDAELVFSGIFGYGSGTAIVLSPGCIGNEGSIFQCPPTNNYGYLTYYLYTNYFYNDIGLRCKQAPPVQCQDGDVRLASGTSGPNTIEGKVEVCYADQWGPVYVSSAYKTLWTLREASVVCRQLQYAPVAVKAYTIPIYGIAQVSGKVSFSQPYCTGYESKLIYCYHSPPGYLYTSRFSSYAVAVRCQASCNECEAGSIRLVGGNTSYDGRVEVCEGGCWGAVCIGDDGWSSRDAAVVCRQLNFDPQGAVPRYYYSLPVPPMLAPHCIGNESSLFNCALSVCHLESYKYAGVLCSAEAATFVWPISIIKTFSATVVTLFVVFAISLVIAIMATATIMKRKQPSDKKSNNITNPVDEQYEVVTSVPEIRSLNNGDVMEMEDCKAYHMVKHD